MGRPSRALRSRSDTREGIDLLPDNLDAISRTLLPRYQEVASEMAPFRQRTIYEVNADLSFYQLNGDVPMQWSKHSEKGMEERRALLEAKMPGVLTDHRRRGSRSDHVAPPRRRCDPLDGPKDLRQGRRVRIPIDPEWDEQGLRMEIVR